MPRWREWIALIWPFALRRDTEMYPQQQPTTIDPERLERINQAVSSTEDTIAAGRQIRQATDRATVKLAKAVKQATGIMGTDLLADREGRMPGRQGQKL